MSQLNRRKPKQTNAQVVAAVAKKHGMTTGYSNNGNLQFNKTSAERLYSLAVRLMVGTDITPQLKDTRRAEIVQHIEELVNVGNYDFIANLAIHARQDMNVRTLPVVIVVEFARALSNKREQILKASEATGITNAAASKLKAQADALLYPHMRQLVCDVIQRADQITDMYAYALEVFGSKNKVPMAIKRGVADAFNKFGEYHFAKYDRAGAVKFRDVARIVHPIAKDAKQGDVFRRLVSGELTVPYTWETQLSMNGQATGGERRSKRDIWTELVTSGQVGYMALLRNLRNIAEAGVDAHVIDQYVNNVIADPKRVATSRQLPYAFMKAHENAPNASMKKAVDAALDCSADMLPRIGNKVWVIVDYSGSMGQGTTSAFNNGVFLAAILSKAAYNQNYDVAITAFGDTAKTMYGTNTNKSVRTLMEELQSHRTGSIAGSTNFEAALDQYDKLAFKPDTVVVITDSEVNRFPYNKLQRIPSDTLKLVVDMSASLTSPMVASNGWYMLAGWSPSMFKWFDACRNQQTAVSQLSGPYMSVSKTEETPE